MEVLQTHVLEAFLVVYLYHPNILEYSFVIVDLLDDYNKLQSDTHQ